MLDGDIYWYNDPYYTKGAVSHLPDMVFIMPVFSSDRLTAFVECWGHLWDIGGSVPGSISPSATSVFQEGIMIPPVRIVRNGVRNEEVFRIFTQNSRFPDLLEGDLNSIMAACELGKQRVESIISKFALSFKIGKIFILVLLFSFTLISYFFSISVTIFFLSKLFIKI